MEITRASQNVQDIIKLQVYISGGIHLLNATNVLEKFEAVRFIPFVFKSLRFIRESCQASTRFRLFVFCFFILLVDHKAH